MTTRELVDHQAALALRRRRAASDIVAQLGHKEGGALAISHEFVCATAQRGGGPWL